MKLITAFFLYLSSLGITTSNIQESQNIEYYRQAKDIVINSKKIDILSKRKTKRFFVSNELPSIITMGLVYRSELKQYLEVTEQDLIAPSNNYILEDDRLLELGTHKRSELKIYFSEIKNNIFFAEIFKSPKKNIKYDQKPYFGMGLIYMFKIDDDKVTNVQVKEIAYL